MKNAEREIARVIAPPPVIYLVPLGVGLGIHFAFPIPFLPDLWLQLAVGLPIIGIAGILVASAILAMRRAGTTPDVYKPTMAIVAGGPFKFSRNPMYLSLTVLYVGIAVAVNAL